MKITCEFAGYSEHGIDDELLRAVAEAIVARYDERVQSILSEFVEKAVNKLIQERFKEFLQGAKK